MLSFNSAPNKTQYSKTWMSKKFKPASRIVLNVSNVLLFADLSWWDTIGDLQVNTSRSHLIFQRSGWQSQKRRPWTVLLLFFLKADLSTFLGISGKGLLALIIHWRYKQIFFSIQILCSARCNVIMFPLPFLPFLKLRFHTLSNRSTCNICPECVARGNILL